MITLTIFILSMIQIQQGPGSTEKEQVQAAVQAFITSGDTRNAAQLDSILHPEFRVVANRLMGGDAVNIITKPTYLQLIKDGKLGGDKRELKIESIQIIENNASVKVTLTGNALTFESFYHLVKTKEGTWLIMEDLPYATKNK